MRVLESKNESHDNSLWPEEFEVKLWMHQGSVLSCFLFADVVGTVFKRDAIG